MKDDNGKKIIGLDTVRYRREMGIDIEMHRRIEAVCGQIDHEDGFGSPEARNIRIIDALLRVASIWFMETEWDNAESTRDEFMLLVAEVSEDMWDRKMKEDIEWKWDGLIGEVITKETGCEPMGREDWGKIQMHPLYLSTSQRLLEAGKVKDGLIDYGMLRNHFGLSSSDP